MLLITLMGTLCVAAQDKVTDSIDYCNSNYRSNPELFYRILSRQYSTAREKENKLAEYYLVLSRIKNQIGEPDSNFHYLQKSKALFETSQDHKGVAETSLNIGNYYYYKGDFSKALDIFLQNISYCEKHHLLSDKGLFCRNAGFIFLNLKKYNEALNYYNQALKIFQDLGSFKEISVTYVNIGSVYFEQFDVDRCEEYNLKALEASSAIHDSINIYKIYNNLGAVNIDNGDTLKGLRYLKQSAGIKEQLHKLEDLILSYDNIGLIYSFIGPPDSAFNYLNKALLLAKKIGARAELPGIYQSFSTYYYNTHDYKMAYYYLNEQMKLRDSILNEENLEQIEEIKTRYEVAKKELEIAAGEQKVKSRNIVITVLILSFIVITLVLLFYFRLRQKQNEYRLNTELKLQQSEHEKEIAKTEEKERRRIAQDLHDNMGAYTTSLLAQIDALSSDTKKLKSENVKELRSDAENIMSTLRETIWILKTKNIDLKVFCENCKIYIDKHLAKNLEVNVTYSENLSCDAELSPSVSLNLYRIIQEVIQNITKHAKAKNVSIAFRYTTGLTIEIKDDGIGFDYDGAINKSGLENMNYRAEEIGYALSVSTEPGRGTLITISELEKHHS